MQTGNTVKQEISKSKILLRDVDLEMKKEFDRRKKLRLQQVRQQSKDLAYTLREKVRLEKSHQQNLCKRERQKQLILWQEDKLKELQALYKSCLKDVGQSHVKAAEQPDVASLYHAQEKKNAEKAANRGMEARQKKKMLDDENRHQNEAPLIRKQLVRTKEDIRSILVSLLSTASSTVGSNSCGHGMPHSCHSEWLKQAKYATGDATRKTEIAVNSQGLSESTAGSNVKLYKSEQEPKIKQRPKVRVLQEIPSNIPLETIEPKTYIHKRHIKEGKTENCKNTKTSTCTDCGYSCCCHSTNRSFLRRCHSESRLVSDSESEYDSDSTWPPRSHQSDFSRQATSVIKCYDYANNFRKKYKKPVCITKHSQRKPDIKSLHEVQSEIELYENKTRNLKEMADKSRHRSRIAIYKDRINRDFESLRKELETLVREERSLTSKVRPKTLPRVNRPKVDLMQRTFMETVNPGNTVISGKAESVVTFDTDTSNVLNVTRQHSRQLPAAQTSTTPFQSDLSQVLGRIQERRKLLLKELEDSLEDSFDAPPNVNKEIHAVQKETHLPATPETIHPTHVVQKETHLPVTSETIRPATPKKQDLLKINPDIVDVHVKSPRNMKPQVDVEIEDAVAGTEGKKKSHKSEEFDGITVTVRVKRNPSKSTQIKPNIPKLRTDYESSSTSYTSPPDKMTPSKKVLVDSLVHELRMKKPDHVHMKPYINRLLSMSRESVDELGGTSIKKSSVLELIQSNEVSPAVDIPDNIHHMPEVLHIPKTEHLTSMYDSLTEKYIQKLFKMSDTFKELLEANDHHIEAISPVSPFERAHIQKDPLLDFMDFNQSIVSAESSYLKLPYDLRNKGFPIHQANVATDFKKYPKADQTFQELADVLIAQEMSLNNINNLLPQPSNDSLRNVQIPDRMEMDSLPVIPDIQEIFSFIRPQFLPTPDPNDSNAESESLNVFQGLSEFEHTTSSRDISHSSHGASPVRSPHFEIHTSKLETIVSQQTLDIPPQPNLVQENTQHPYNVSSPEEIESEFLKMGLGWAGTTLRKTREAAELSAGSSSEKNVSFSPSKSRRHATNVVKHSDRSVRLTHKSRYSSPINSQSPPPHFLSTSIDSIGGEIGVYSKKKKKKITKQRIKLTSDSDLTPPNVSLRTPNTTTSKYPNPNKYI